MRTNIKRLAEVLVICGSSLLLATTAKAVELEWTKVGDITDGMGWAAAGVDVTGDGKKDVVVGCPASKKVKIFDGPSNGATLLFTLTDYKAGEFGVTLGPLGHIDDDSFEDFVVSDRTAWNRTSKVYVYRGQGPNTAPVVAWKKDAKLMGTGTIGQYFPDSPGDFNGDGYNDVVVTAAGPKGGVARTYVFSGPNGAQLAVFYEYGKVEFVDVNGDGYSDLLLSTAGRVHVHLGHAGSEPDVEASYSPLQAGLAEDQFGQSISAIGDNDLDGYHDFVIGAGTASSNGLTKNGRMYVYSGLDGALISSADGMASEERLGTHLAGVGDYDGDGKRDIASGEINRDILTIFSGQGLTRIYSYSPQPDPQSFGMVVEDLGDTQGDGFSRVLVYENVIGGKIYIFSSKPQ